MSRLRTWWGSAVDLSVVALQTLISLFRGGRSWQIIITGPDAVSMEFLATSIQGALSRGVTPGLLRTSATETGRLFSPVVVTAHLNDITRVEDITRSVGRFRRLVVVAPTADPRQMVCEQRADLPHQFFDAFDYRFLVGPGGLKSFTEPGVLPRYEGLTQWQSHPRATVLCPSREAVEADPGQVFLDIAQVVRGGLGRKIRDALTTLSVSPPSLSPTPHWSKQASTKARVLSQVRLAPALEDTATQQGYPPLPKASRTQKAPVPRGTVIAFHTPDEVYRAEAERLKSTLNALGLDHHFFEVTPEKNWVRTTLLKPSWIAKAREELSGPLLYIDVDAFVHHDPWPYLSQYDGDMAAVVYNNGQLNSATLWINDTLGARRVLNRWLELANERRELDEGGLEPTGDNGDQGVLKQAVLEDESLAQPTFSFQRLPVNLAYIFDRTDTYIVGPVIIEQLQASRESIGHDKRLARRRDRLRELEQGARENQVPTG